MNILHGMGGESAGGGGTPAGHPLGIGIDERRMHVRAYNYWVSLLRGRAYPSIEDLNPGNVADFGANSVLLDFSKGVHDPGIRYLGEALSQECRVASSIRRISEVPARSLLSRLTDHYLQIIANRAPIGFEAEFVGQRGDDTLYRGILMPFSSDDETIDFIYGVINWKVMVDADTQASLVAEVEAARRELQTSTGESPAAWADGPSAGFDVLPQAEIPLSGETLDMATGLAEALSHARDSATDANAAEDRARTVLYRALDRTYGLLVAGMRDPSGYASLLSEAGAKPTPHTPELTAVQLVFGSGRGRAQLAKFAAVLAHARRLDIQADGFASFLRNAEGGIDGIFATELIARREARA